MGNTMDLEFRTKLAYGGTQYKLRLFNKTVWVSNHFNDCGWFRLFGSGLHWKHEKLGLRFSERNGNKKYLKIGKWIFSCLPNR